MLDAVALAERFPNGLRGVRMHALGAGGSGISSVVRLAREQGAEVSGCDISETTMTRLLRAQGVPMAIGHDAAHAEGMDLLVTNPMVTALDPDHFELVAARERGAAVAQWQALLGYLMRARTGVSVAGVHGKGSTTALLGALAEAGGLDPTVELGAVVPSWGGNVRVGQGALFINEADEWNYNFLHYHPRVVVLTAVEFDHPEFFADYAAIREAFVRFLRGMDTSPASDGVPGPALVLNADSPGCLDVLADLGPWPGQVRYFGVESARATVRARDVRADVETSFTLEVEGADLGRVVLTMPGAHNIANAVAAAAAADVLGVPRAAMVPALSAFPGLRRRFEIIEDGDVTFIDDYAHHPHAIALTLETARARFPGRRLIAVFQATLYTRLYRFLTPFAAALAAADVAVVVETQASRERDTGLVHGRDLVAEITRQPAFADHPADAYYGGTFAETAQVLRSLRQPGDVIAVLGSGPVNAVIAQARLT